jgi:hypothetical protein
LRGPNLSAHPNDAFAILDPSISLECVVDLASILARQTHEPQSMKRTAAVKRAMAARPASFGAVLLRAVVLVPASALLMGVAVEHAAAQTLTNPNPPSKWSAPQGTAKSHTSAQTKKSCTEFGAGFVNVPGTDTCVKVGGFVTVEGGSRGR